MSIPLLENPDNIHDLVDDLESVFWVFVYVAVKRFSAQEQPLRHRLMLMFDEETLDSQYRIVGGCRKTSCLFSNDLLRSRFTDGTLHKLLSDIGHCWDMYHCARTDSFPTLVPQERKDSGTRMLKLAPPTFALDRTVRRCATTSLFRNARWNRLDIAAISCP